MKVKIGDTTWKVLLLSDKKFSELYGDDTAAITVLDDKTLNFSTNHMDMETIRHELYHAYVSLTLTHDSDMNKDAMEELAASVIGKYGEALIVNSRKIHKYLKRIEQSANETNSNS